MDQKFKFLIILFLAIGVNFYSEARQKDNKTIKFTGSVIDHEGKENYNRILLNYWPDDGFAYSGTHFLAINLDSIEHFEFNLPDLGKPYKMTMSIVNTEATKNLWGSEYYVEPGDEVDIKIVLNHRDSAIFSGPGMEKYRLISSMLRQYKEEYLPELDLIKIGPGQVKDINDLNTKMDKLGELIRKQEAKRLTLIDAAKLSPLIRALVIYEYSRYYREWTERSGNLYNGYLQFQKSVVDNYLKFSSEFFYRPDTLSILCPRYISHLSVKNAFEMKIRNIDRKIDIVSFYNEIKSNYTGALRDRLIGQFAFGKATMIHYAAYDSSKMDSLLRDAIPILNVQYVKKSIKDRSEALGKVSVGSSLMDSSFILPNAGTLHLKQLKGKVILIDTWFLGCGGCAFFHQKFEKEIRPKLLKNDDFVVLSINIDKRMDIWDKGIESKRYTGPENINVTTLTGLDHPFMKYYNVKGAPYLMLVDRSGKIRYQPRFFNITEMTDKINEVLVDKSSQ